MKKLAVALLLVVGLVLVGCGSNNSNSSNINGNWTAALANNDGTQAFTFTTSITENSDGTLSVTNLTFSSTTCFKSPGETESGSFALGGNFNGNVTGQFQFKVVSASPSNNVLNLTGTANGNTIKGTWTLTGGTACQGSGSFTMTKG